MKNILARLCLAVVALVVLGCSTALAGILPVPAGLQPGDHYHLLFVTTTKTTADSPDIATYDALANLDANSAGRGSAIGIEWYAMAATVNPYTAPALYSDNYPVYNMRGELMGSSAMYLWNNGPLASTYLVNGDLSYSSSQAWTGGLGVRGSLPGTPSATEFPLGHQNTAGPGFLAIGTMWASSGWASPSNLLPVFAISDAITVAPEPGTLTLAAAALLGLGTVALARRRRMS
ncbi:MAG: hypothetical protein LLG00_02370 [Planctomycetaceae bacterium]|nr:hypothetical protein [Planctomycetaceae bacterium]